MLMELGEVSRVLIVWNNEVRYASPAGAIINTWPPLSKPLKVVNMLSNKLTNRLENEQDQFTKIWCKNNV